jgi:hypothetical protein
LETVEATDLQNGATELTEETEAHRALDAAGVGTEKKKPQKKPKAHRSLDAAGVGRAQDPPNTSRERRSSGLFDGS